MKEIDKETGSALETNLCNLKIAVIGAGAAGLMCAGTLKKRGAQVVVFDGNEKAGKKLYITGKGRCNLTNLKSPDEFLEHVVRGGKFLRSAIHRFSSADAVDFFENLGLSTKLERGDRVFPASDKASDVTKVLQNVHCRGVDFRFCCKVQSVKKEGGDEKLVPQNEFLQNEKSERVASESVAIATTANVATENPEDRASENAFIVTANGKQERFDRVVVATGGKSYTATGSTGDGYEIAKKFAHKITPLEPALCPIKIKDSLVKELQGVSLKNVTLHAEFDGKKMEFFGEMLFTDCGISGPIVLSASSYINRAKDVRLFLDFKPALTETELDARLLREIDLAKNKEVSFLLRTLLPKAVASVFAKVFAMDEKKKNNSLTKAEREKIVYGLKNFPLAFDGLYPLDAAIVTSGGVCTDEVNPKTFESKLATGLFFVGEILDCDALTGGYNLQIAWASATCCAREMK